MAEIKTAEDLQKELDQLTSDFNALQTKYNDALTANGSLTAEIEKLTDEAVNAVEKTVEEKINPADHTFIHEGIEYGFNYAKSVLQNKVITPIEVKADKAIQALLIKIKSGMIFKKSK